MISKGLRRVGAALIAGCLLWPASQLFGQFTVNVDLQRDVGAAYHGPSAVDSGAPIWNHVVDGQVTGLRDTRGGQTGVGLELQGEVGRFRTTWTEHELLGDFVYHLGAGRARALLSGLDPRLRYDVVLYPSPDGARFWVGGVSRDAVFGGTGAGGDPAYDRGAAFVAGKNYTTFRNVTPNAGGRILIE